MDIQMTTEIQVWCFSSKDILWTIVLNWAILNILITNNLNDSDVISGSEENKSFAKYTPSGNLHIWISYETQASDAFEPGKEYYLDILPVE